MQSERNPIEQFNEVLGQQHQLALNAQTASKHSHDIFLRAIEAADRRLAELAEAPEVRGHLTEASSSYTQGLEELDSLEEAIVLGIISKEEVDDRRTAILQQAEADPVVSFALRYLGAVALTTEKTNLRTPLDTEPNRQQQATGAPERDGVPEKRNIDITYDGNSVQIGAGGQCVKMSSKKSEGNRDYAKERIAILEALIKHGKPVRAVELWQSAFGDKEFDRHVMSQTRNWLTKLTYRHKPLIIHNGKRGSSSSYQVEPAFNLRLIKNDAAEQPTVDQKTIDLTTDIQLSDLQTPEVDDGNQIQLDSHPASQEEIQTPPVNQDTQAPKGSEITTENNQRQYDRRVKLLASRVKEFLESLESENPESIVRRTKASEGISTKMGISLEEADLVISNLVANGIIFKAGNGNGNSLISTTVPEVDIGDSSTSDLEAIEVSSGKLVWTETYTKTMVECLDILTEHGGKELKLEYLLAGLSTRGTIDEAELTEILLSKNARTFFVLSNRRDNTQLVRLSRNELRADWPKLKDQIIAGLKEKEVQS